MYASATSGDKDNNRRFSPCSVRSVYDNLNAELQKPSTCFVDDDKPFCGNGVVERSDQNPQLNEDCDCGKSFFVYHARTPREIMEQRNN